MLVAIGMVTDYQAPGSGVSCRNREELGKVNLMLDNIGTVGCPLSGQVQHARRQLQFTTDQAEPRRDP